MHWLRSKEYIDYFESLDRDGGFFYERWGDAPVHSIAAGLLLKKEEIHFFNEIAYYHIPFTHCPTGEQLRLDLKCHCNPKDNFDWKGYSCKLAHSRSSLHLPCFVGIGLLTDRHTGTSRFFQVNDMTKPAGYEDES